MMKSHNLAIHGEDGNQAEACEGKRPGLSVCYSDLFKGYN
jgi:hypothetical protein